MVTMLLSTVPRLDVQARGGGEGPRELGLARSDRLCRRKGFGCEIVPIFHTVFARVYHYARSELCKGLYHPNGV